MSDALRAHYFHYAILSSSIYWMRILYSRNASVHYLCRSFIEQSRWNNLDHGGVRFRVLLECLQAIILSTQVHILQLWQSPKKYIEPTTEVFTYYFLCNPSLTTEEVFHNFREWPSLYGGCQISYWIFLQMLITLTDSHMTWGRYIPFHLGGLYALFPPSVGYYMDNTVIPWLPHADVLWHFGPRNTLLLIKHAIIIR